MESTQKTSRRKSSRPWDIGCSAWCKKYFWEGQLLSSAVAAKRFNEPESAAVKFLKKYRRPISFLLPMTITHFAWWSIMISHDLLYLFKERYTMSITMIIGSLVAGMTCEGGGAVAFPVMTLVLGVAPSSARDFSLYIQATGMGCATFSILFMGVQVEWYTIMCGTAGGALGLLVGLHFVDPYLSASAKKMGFVSIWFAFAFTLFLLNRYHKRTTYEYIINMKLWKVAVLIFTGFIGGLLTSFAGTGLDISVFSIITLLFRVSEKIATPTSVITMALNSMLGVFWRTFVLEEVTEDTLKYFAVCAQVVVVGAPTGAILGSHFHRQVLAAFIYILDTASLVTAFALVPQTPLLAGVSVAIIVFGFIFFGVLIRIGSRMIMKEEEVLALKQKEATSMEDGHIMQDGKHDVFIVDDNYHNCTHL